MRSKNFSVAVKNPSSPVRTKVRRLLHARWKPPDQFVVTPEGVEEVRTNVREGVLSFVGPSFPHFAIVIAHTNENPEQTLRVEWD